MKQYCRYCAFCFEGDGYHCSDKDTCLSERQIKRANTCKNFALSELGDVVTGKAYKPRVKTEKHYKGQLTFEDIINGDT